MIKHRPDSLVEFEKIRHHEQLQNPRKNVTEDLEDLILSLKTKGMHSPMYVWRVSKVTKPTLYFLLGGFRRYAAVTVLREESPELLKQFRKVPVVCWEGTLEDAQFEMLAHNLRRKSLKPYEIAESMQKLKATDKYKQKEIAEKLGVTPGYVSQMLTFSLRAQDNQEVKEAVHNEEIPMDAGKEILDSPKELQSGLLEVAKKAKEEGKNVKEVVERKKGKRQSRPSKDDLLEARKILPEGEMDDDTLKITRSFEAALDYAAGELTLTKAALMAGISLPKDFIDEAERAEKAEKEAKRAKAAEKEKAKAKKKDAKTTKVKKKDAKKAKADTKEEPKDEAPEKNNGVNHKAKNKDNLEIPF